FEGWELLPWQDDPALLQLLASFAAILPLRRASELRDPKIRNRVLVLTEGVTVRICRLLEAAAIQGIEARFPEVPFRDAFVDDQLSPSARSALAKFLRVTEHQIKALELRQQFPILPM